MKTAHGKYCGDFPKPKQPFVSTPFFGKYSRTGVKDNQVDPGSYTTSAGQEAGDGSNNGADGTGTGNGSA